MANRTVQRVSIRSVMAFIIVLAVGFAAIRSGSAAWAGAMFSITFFSMICSLLGVALCRGMRRTYWLGFATLGWSYLILMFVPWLHENVGQFLLASNLFEYLEEVLHSAPLGGTGLQSLPVEALVATVQGGGFSGGTGVAALSDSVRIGVAIEALLWAFLGGWLACYFASGRDRDCNSGVAAPPGAS